MSDELSESDAKSVAVVNTYRYTNASSNTSAQIGCCCVSDGCRRVCRAICASRLWHSVWGRVRRMPPYVQKQAVALATRYHSRRCVCCRNRNLSLNLSLPRAILLGALACWLAFAALYLPLARRLRGPRESDALPREGRVLPAGVHGRVRARGHEQPDGRAVLREGAVRADRRRAALRRRRCARAAQAVATSALKRRRRALHLCRSHCAHGSRRYSMSLLKLFITS